MKIDLEFPSLLLQYLQIVFSSASAFFYAKKEMKVSSKYTNEGLEETGEVVLSWLCPHRRLRKKKKIKWLRPKAHGAPISFALSSQIPGVCVLCYFLHCCAEMADTKQVRGEEFTSVYRQRVRYSMAGMAWWQAARPSRQTKGQESGIAPAMPFLAPFIQFGLRVQGMVCLTFNWDLSPQ